MDIQPDARQPSAIFPRYIYSENRKELKPSTHLLLQYSTVPCFKTEYANEQDIASL